MGKQRGRQGDAKRGEQGDPRHGQQSPGRTSQQCSRSQSQEGSGGPVSHKQDRADRQQSQQNVYGEGNYAASRQYNEATKKFAQSGRVESAAEAAAPRSDADAMQMQAAEAEGKRHAKGEDPALHRKGSEQPSPKSRPPRPGEEEE